MVTGLGLTTGPGLVTGLAGADDAGGGLASVGLTEDVRLPAGFDTLGVEVPVRDGVASGTDGDGEVVGTDRGGTSAAGSELPPKTTDAQPSCHPASATPATTSTALTPAVSLLRRAGDRRGAGASTSGSGSSRKSGRVALVRRGGSGSGSQPGGTACRSAPPAAESSIGQPQERQYLETILFNCSHTGH